MRKIRAVAIKELRQIRRDPLTLVMLLGVPAFMLLLYGYALNFDVRHVRLAVQDQSHSQASRGLVDGFVQSTYFDLVATVAPGSDLERLLAERVAKVVLVIPRDFATRLERGQVAPVQLLVDGADASTATTVLSYANGVLGEANIGLVAAVVGTTRHAERQIPVTLLPRVLFNPELRSTQFLVPGLMGFILMLTAVLSTALSVVREKERGTMEQLRVTALRPAQLIIGKLIPYLVISLLATGVILVAARVLFGVAVKGSYLDLFIVTLIYLIGALGFGLLVSSIARTQAMAFQVGAVTSMLPAIFLSGFIFPIRSMPVFLQWLTLAVPARYYLVALRGVMLKGSDLTPYRHDVLFLIAYATVVMGIAFIRLSRPES